MSLQNKTLMPPPWLAYRQIECCSIGWRMGYGEYYLDQFLEWFDSLSDEEQSEYRTLFPEPLTWKGWWDKELSDDGLEHGGFFVNTWQPQGKPKYNLKWLQQEFAQGNTKEMCHFWGNQPSKNGKITKSCFSQWWKQDFRARSHTFLYAEQCMMASKARLFGDDEILKQILACDNPKQIKDFGRKVRGFDEEVWNKFKYTIVLLGNWHKFNQNIELKDFLLSTGDIILVEASPYDIIWGIGLAENCTESQNPMLWRGQNLLGFALMEVRDELRRVTQNEKLCDFSTVED
ncbi:NADAR family protein [Anaerobiospirillum succiniciproducens]|uniref:NADAR family protein n=1 Tax=Anaerobiospirillum succiniciproducens TaxID=13335 RepID=UPI0004846687|nr:NADAR family protein [Anaerobiospirillum succiniciproducens]